MSLEINAVQEAQRRLNRAALTVAQLRKENRYLRARLTDNGRAGRILRRARDDAYALLLWRSTGFYPSLSWCLEQGLSERRWQWARAFLRVARLYDGRDYAAEDMEFAGRRLRSTYERLRGGEDEQLEELRRRMPKKYRL